MDKTAEPIQGQCIHSETGAFGEVRVFENDSVRWLQFGNDAIQSVMSLQYPERITVRYMQQMMASLLFCEHPPKRAMLLGLGGGALLRFLRHCLKHIDFEVVEHDAHVIKVASKYFDVTHNGEDIIIEHAVVEEYVKQCEEVFDLVLLDIIEDMSTPACFFNEDFFEACRQRCGDNGVFAVNLIVENDAAFKQIYSSIRAAFDQRTLCMTDPDHRNIVILAFSHQPGHLDRQALTERAALLHQCHIELVACIENLFEVNPSEDDKLVLHLENAE